MRSAWAGDANAAPPPTATTPAVAVIRRSLLVGRMKATLVARAADGERGRASAPDARGSQAQRRCVGLDLAGHAIRLARTRSRWRRWPAAWRDVPVVEVGAVDWANMAISPR